MIANSMPRYLLWVDVESTIDANYLGKWSFTLEEIAGEDRLEVFDAEPDVAQERLELQTVVRGLEALDQPSRVTVVTSSHYVGRGFRRGLPDWRENDWRWERFGEMTTIKNADLWKRLDRIMNYHEVECRLWRVDHGNQFNHSEEISEVAVGRRKVDGEDARQRTQNRGSRTKSWLRKIGQATQKVSQLATSIVSF